MTEIAKTLGERIRDQGCVRALALAEDFFSRAPRYRTKAKLVEIAEFVLSCHGDDAFSAGKQEGWDDAKVLL